MDLLRLSTVGSVDDGKSTLIGRLLYDSKEIFEDQLAAVERASLKRGDGYVNLALLTDGLRAEREQGITIDVAYRYFTTPRRKFIIADTPGHVQYTRNMVTGGSTAQLSVVLIDAREGVKEQTRRHAVIASLLDIPHLVVCINKMDLVDWSESAFAEARDEFAAFAARLDGIRETTFIPVSALHGDNVVTGTDRMPWYAGPTLLGHLETVDVADRTDWTRRRFPVQWIIRPMTGAHHDYRAAAGRIEGGMWRPGDEVLALPSGGRSRVHSIVTYGGLLDEAFPPLSVAITLEDDIDAGRGEMLVGPESPPLVATELTANVCWMTDRPLEIGGRYSLKHATRTVRAIVVGIQHRLDINTLAQIEDVTSLGLNEIGLVDLRLSMPIPADAYRDNRTTGSFILIDESTHVTVGAGMIVRGRPYEPAEYTI
ncbi:MAG: 50S ribosome-binding GTPase [Chloroflexi bacterium]|nr:50S ribosome-binding GTPase [Chloroflexota bacterium]